MVNADLDTSLVLGNRDQRRTYLITYSQADLSIVQDVDRFAEILKVAIEPAAVGGVVRAPIIEHYAVCMESHADGNKHYHMSVKLSKPKKWHPIKNAILRVNGISLHFSAQHLGYVACYRYVRKNKPKDDVLHSAGHPNLDLMGQPRTQSAMQMNRSRAEARRNSSVVDDGNVNSEDEDEQVQQPRKIKRVSNDDVSDFMVTNNIKTEVELMREAFRRSEEGERDLYSFILRKNPKALADLINTTWKLQNAPKDLERQESTAFEIIQRNAIPCQTEGCNGQWFEMARHVLRLNRINAFVYADAMRTSFTRGREKFTNIFLHGGTNCGKSFLLNPLEIIFKAFVNPATGRYAWVGLDNCEVAYLNDFRWSAELISWSDLLLLLEGATVHLPRPKNIFATDLCIPRTNILPVFATSKAPLKKSEREKDKDENRMMDSRWKFFHFTTPIPEDEMRPMNPCANCFSNLVMLGVDG